MHSAFLGNKCKFVKRGSDNEVVVYYHRDFLDYFPAAENLLPSFWRKLPRNHTLLFHTMSPVLVKAPCLYVYGARYRCAVMKGLSLSCYLKRSCFIWHGIIPIYVCVCVQWRSRIQELSECGLFDERWILSFFTREVLCLSFSRKGMLMHLLENLTFGTWHWIS